MADGTGRHIFTTDDWDPSGGVYTVRNRTTKETIGVTAPVVWFDDFIGDSVNALWTTTTIETGGSPAAAIKTATDAPNGVVVLDLDSTSEEQQCRLDWGDAISLNPNKNLQAEFRVNLSGTPSAAAVSIAFGLSGSANKVTESQGDHVSFIFSGGADLTISSDDGATDTTAFDTGVDGADGTYLICRMDLSDLSAVKFYINGAYVTTTVDVSGLAATDYLQPYIQLYKASGAGTAEFEVDYVRIWSER